MEEEVGYPLEVPTSHTIVLQFSKESLMTNFIKGLAEVHDKDVCLSSLVQIVVKITDES